MAGCSSLLPPSRIAARSLTISHVPSQTHSTPFQPPRGLAFPRISPRTSPRVFPLLAVPIAPFSPSSHPRASAASVLAAAGAAANEAPNADPSTSAGSDPALAAAAWEALKAVRASRPLVHCITNYVSMDAAANTLLAAGAAPAMVHSLEEVEEFASLASALYVNIGTLSPDWVDAMKRAAKVVSARNRPWVLDPVGCGATTFRTKTSTELLALRPTVVRGNASEVLALAGAVNANTRGVDSTLASTAAVAAAQQLAAASGAVVAVSGATDFITDGSSAVIACDNGVPMLQAITATGCSVTALIAAFVAAAPAAPTAAGNTTDASAASDLSPPLLATTCALAIFGLAAEVALAAATVHGPGSLRVGLMDALYSLQEEQVLQGVKLHLVSL